MRVMFSAKAQLGDLERAVLDVLWGPEAAPRDAAETLSVREVVDALNAERDLAYTTVMTVLDRMAKKGLLVKQRDGRAHRYRASGTRGEMTADLMRGALAEFAQEDRRSALVAFVGEASEEERDALRAALAALEAAAADEV